MNMTKDDFKKMSKDELEVLIEEHKKEAAGWEDTYKKWVALGVTTDSEQQALHQQRLHEASAFAIRAFLDAQASIKRLRSALTFSTTIQCTGEGHLMSLQAAVDNQPHHHTVAQCVSGGCDCKCRTKLNTEIQNALKETE